MPAVPRSSKPIFSIALRPPRSLSRRGARNVVFLLAATTTMISVIFWSVGAWPVIGFLGIDVIFLALAFHFSFRSARQEERIDLHPGNLRVTRIPVRGTRQYFDFQPYWLRVVLERGEDETCSLFLQTHGKSLEIAGFLGPDDKADLAAELEAVLRKTRCNPGPPPVSSL
ncbi:DUF2244 domain-containing protein [Thalassospira lucentensis]|uniref:DUF2244 domain-containing protein n=1 Tax=Thalassospira lucentensis TaxID=168935 RepID=UPI00142D8CD9|nr:DUF2244 domain-containing protein [Thalassospira lucentensis]